MQKFVLFFSMLLVFATIVGCTDLFGDKDPFSEAKMHKAYVDFRKTAESVAGIYHNPKIETFMYDNIIEIKNFHIVKGYDITPTEHYIEFTFDTFYRINASDFEKKFPLAELSKAVGEKSAKEAIQAFAEKKFKAGESDGKNRHLAMVLKKYDAGWTVEEVGFPK